MFWTKFKTKHSRTQVRTITTWID